MSLEDLRLAYPALFWAACLNAALIIPSAAGLALDYRRVTGINPWIKPLKFEISVLVYVLTIAWMLIQLEGAASAKQIIANGIAAAMSVEISAVVMQAARGVPSHFNESTPLNAIVFALMGLLILANTLLAAWLAALYFLTPTALAPAVLWGARLGLILFLIASAQGALIVRNKAHTVGAADGGPGLPFLNWSTRFGDLRVAHFAGMHGIQILPAVGAWLGTPAVAAVFAAMVALFVFTLRQALAARPLLRL